MTNALDTSKPSPQTKKDRILLLLVLPLVSCM
jgi:hypothetical protein